ncbi:hypothetical protein [Staphylococcus argenteus]|uniref:hypothetical protein n=1 Tax=Staphylococcus argenteus TaxID=985002 RepID=UPI001FB911F5|nr:hypothetical protein [Staphylococcus argenteus]GJF94483.1 hypothetical protein SASC210_25670 [Staphylococcus argenteus]GJF99789.1 hypothetical protein SASC253_25870 [Staphylococcus argenteus]GJG15698.1 hypothetical protein SASC262_25660 [Staphylococcus argenteus]GJG18364.1 hypothetical protein SASC264_25890 [Staphylococcus argenteus]GJG20986.1 hypothetical protein SASC268_25750 [Staphylococcus argenteus]
MSKKSKMTLTIDSDIKEALNLMKKNVATYYSNVSVSYLIEYMTKLIIHRYLNDEQLFIEFNDELREELKALGFDEKTFKTITGEEFEKRLELENKIEKNEAIIKQQQAVIDKYKKDRAEEQAKLTRLEKQLENTEEKVKKRNEKATTMIKEFETRKQKEDKSKELAQALDFIKFVDSNGRTYQTINIKNYNEYFKTDEGSFDVTNEKQLANLKELARHYKVRIIFDGERLKSQMVTNVKETEATENDEGGKIVTEVRVKDISKEIEFEDSVKEREIQREKLKEQTKEAIERLEKAKSSNKEEDEEVEYDEENDVNNFYEFKVDIIKPDGSQKNYEFDDVELNKNNLNDSKVKIVDTIMNRVEQDSRKNTVLRKLINDNMTENVVEDVLDNAFQNEENESIGLITIELGLKEVTFQICEKSYELEDEMNGLHEFYLNIFGENGSQRTRSVEKFELKSNGGEDYHIDYNKPIIVNLIVEELDSMGIEEFEIDNLIKNELTDEIIEDILDKTEEDEMSKYIGLLTVDVNDRTIEFEIVKKESSE